VVGSPDSETIFLGAFSGSLSEENLLRVLYIIVHGKLSEDTLWTYNKRVSFRSSLK
jgi:hypothetical protein